MNICIYGSANEDIDISFRTAGEALGEALASHGHTLIFGGGASGMMGAVARGVRKKGGEVIGISPEFFNVDGVLFEDCTKMIYTEDMRTRKQKLEDMADAFIVTPGGIGTMDEFFETISLNQLKFINKPLIISLLENSANMHFLAREDLDLYYATDNPKEIIKYLENNKIGD